MDTSGSVPFAHLLRRARVAAGLTQEELAERAGVGVRAISDLERGAKHAPREDTVRLLAAVLGLGAEEAAAFQVAAQAPPAGRGAVASADAGAPGAGTSEGAGGQTAPPAPDLPTGTLTFLLTDIEGSSAYWERYPAAMQGAIARHDALMDEVLARHGGRQIKEHGEGDSIFAVFASAREALAAACALQRALLAEPWPPETPLRVRMGLHTGEAELRGIDYYGAAVNRAARIRSLAHGGQILLSQSTRDLVCDALPGGIGLRSLGAHRLKDLQRPEEIYQLLHPDLPADFPPLHGAVAAPTNLPAALTSFVGREQAKAEVRRLLGRSRLVTLTGAGGVGKTRLALAVAAEVLQDFPEGVWLADLASLTDPALLPQRVAAVLGVREEPGRPLPATLTNHLASKHLLLLLDNCEHLVAACAELGGALLRACPGLRILATSREALEVAGEAIWRVPSLSLPDPRRPPPLGRLLDSEAVRLFLERARARQPGFGLTEENAAAVAEICRRLDGIPLAIELAAARVGVLGVEQIAARLRDCFRLLTGGPRTAPPRQQTLRAALDWSHDLLSEPERVLLRRLSVFAGGWTLEAAEAVCGDGDTFTTEAQSHRGGTKREDSTKGGGSARGNDVLDPPASLAEDHRTGAHDRQSSLPSPSSVSSLCLSASVVHVPLAPHDVLEVLSGLVGKSLALQEERAGEARYRLLEPVRQYAHERLVASGEAEAVRDRHLDWYAALAEQAAAALLGPEQGTWLARLEAEHDNLRAALAWSAREAGRPAAGLQLAGALWRFWEVHAHWREGREWLEALLARGGAAPAEVRARALHGAGTLAWLQGDHGRARALHEESLALWRELGERRGVADCLNGLGSVAYAQAEYVRATTLFEESLALWRAQGDARGTASTLYLLGIVATYQADYGRAAALLEESLALRRALKDPSGTASTLNRLADVAHYQGDYGRAAALLEESLALRRELGNQTGIAESLSMLGNVEQLRGRHARAWALQEESMAIRRELGDRLGIAGSLISMGLLAFHQGEIVQAAAMFAESLGLFRELGERWGIAGSLEGLAGVAAARRQAGRAARLFGAGAALREAIGAPLPPAYRPLYDRVLAAARAALDEGTFADAWAQGRAMSPEQAIAFGFDTASLLGSQVAS